MRQFVIRMLNLILIAGVILVYQQNAAARAEVVAAHDAEMAEAQALQDKYDAMVREAKMKNTVDEASEAGLKDGVYEGSGTGFGGDIIVKLTIENNAITKAEITAADSEDPEYLSKAETLLDEIVAEQTTELDTISGATFSSKGILEAATAALEGAQ